MLELAQNPLSSLEIENKSIKRSMNWDASVGYTMGCRKDGAEDRVGCCFNVGKMRSRGARHERRATSAQERARIIGNVLKKLENCKEEIYPRDLERR
jgi:hypothetical protein